MKSAVEMGSGAMIRIPSFINILSGIQKFFWGGIHRHTGRRSDKAIFIFPK
jgi:hypothetical protein